MKLLTLARDLQRRKARERQGCFVAEGVRSVEVLLASSLSIVGVLVDESFGEDERSRALLDAARARSVPVKRISETDFTSAASTESPQGVLAVGEIPSVTLPAPTYGPTRYLLLDALQDPGNVGTIIRTAAALGVTATVALPGTVDLWNAKVVRSTMGALFAHPALAASWQDVTTFIREHDVSCWAADADGVRIDSDVPLRQDSRPTRLALIVSNEGAGLSAQASALATQRVAIGMVAGAESLNVAVAAGILMHALRAG